MFLKCIYLEKINREKIDTNKVTNISRMFQKYTNLKEINFSQSFVTKNGSNNSLMFISCQSLKNLNLIKVDTQNVESIKITKIRLSSFKTDKVKDIINMFKG